MATSLKKLKAGNGQPPAHEQFVDVVSLSPRNEPVESRALQVRIPIPVFEDFSSQAGLEFGYCQGAKKKMFLKVWRSYTGHNK